MDKYIILKAKNVQKLTEIVNAAIETGYIVQGHPFQDWYSVYQAMVLKPEIAGAVKVGPTEFKSRSKN